MSRIKYVRVSTPKQNLCRQEQDLSKFDKVYSEKSSGTSLNRPELWSMLDSLAPGDVIEVEDFSRVARSAMDFLMIMDEVKKKGATLVSQKEQIDTSTPQGRLMLTIFAGLAEFERDMIVERTQAGKAVARAKGQRVDGRPKKFTPQQMQHAMTLLDEGNSYTAVEDMTGISKSTLIRARREAKANA